MNICGVLVHANPSKVNTVGAALQAMDGVEIHLTAEGGRLIVTVEDTTSTRAFDTLTEIHRLDGIIAASLVYHHFEPLPGPDPAPAGDMS